MNTLDALLRDRRVIVSTGAGGVGKTTTAAALALNAALAGRKTLALTVDPSRRLAQALGVFVNDAEGLDPEVLDHPPGEGVAEPRDGRRDEVALDAGHRARVFDDHPLDLEAPAVAAVLGPPAGEAHRLADRHVADGPHRDLFALGVAQAGDREGAVGGAAREHCVAGCQ